MTFLQFYGGVGEIGGNKILLEDEGIKIWLDFGQSFKMGEDYFTGWLQPRIQNGLGDYFEFNLLPKLKGLYSENLLEGTPLKYEEPRFNGIFISHAHFDHFSHICFIDPIIPIYCGSGTKLFLEASEEAGVSSNYGSHEYKTFRSGVKIKLDGLELTPIHVDHSVPASYGFIIETSSGTVVYTGDLRAHGPKHEMTEEFIKAAVEAEPVALISEGTRMGVKEKHKNLSEDEVLKGVKEILDGIDGSNLSVLYTHNSRDTDRFLTFYKAAESYGKYLVITPRFAYLLLKLVKDEHLKLPNPLSDDLIKVYYRRKKSGKYSETDYYEWERIFWEKKITAKEVKKHPGKYMMDLGFYYFTELIDLRPKPGSPFIYSMSEPFDEGNIEDQVLHNWLDHFGLRYHQLHASGHMSKKEIKETIFRINPKTVYPVHTENPSLFSKFYDKVVIPKKGRKYDLI